MEMETFKNHLLQQPKIHCNNLKIIYCNNTKISFQRGETARTYKQQGDGFEVQAALALTHHLRARRRKEGKNPRARRNPTTAVSLRSREGRRAQIQRRRRRAQI
jgi:hypothetical protein